MDFVFSKTFEQNLFSKSRYIIYDRPPEKKKKKKKSKCPSRNGIRWVGYLVLMYFLLIHPTFLNSLFHD